MRSTTTTKPGVFWLVYLVLLIIPQAQAQSLNLAPPPAIDVIKVDTSLVTVNVSVTDTRKSR